MRPPGKKAEWARRTWDLYVCRPACLQNRRGARGRADHRHACLVRPTWTPIWKRRAHLKTPPLSGLSIWHLYLERHLYLGHLYLDCHRDTAGRDATGGDTSYRDTSGRDTSGRDASDRDASDRDTASGDASGGDTAGALLSPKALRFGGRSKSALQ